MNKINNNHIYIKIYYLCCDDMIIEIMLLLPIRDINNFHLINKRSYANIHKNNHLWSLKVNKNYPTLTVDNAEKLSIKPYRKMGFLYLFCHFYGYGKVIADNLPEISSFHIGDRDYVCAISNEQLYLIDLKNKSKPLYIIPNSKTFINNQVTQVVCCMDYALFISNDQAYLLLKNDNDDNIEGPYLIPNTNNFINRDVTKISTYDHTKFTIIADGKIFIIDLDVFSIIPTFIDSLKDYHVIDVALNKNTVAIITSDYQLYTLRYNLGHGNAANNVIRYIATKVMQFDKQKVTHILFDNESMYVVADNNIYVIRNLDIFLTSEEYNLYKKFNLLSKESGKITQLCCTTSLNAVIDNKWIIYYCTLDKNGSINVRKVINEKFNNVIMICKSIHEFYILSSKIKGSCVLNFNDWVNSSNNN